MKIAQAMSFQTHEKISINFYYYDLKKEPVEGFAAVTLQQAAAADKKLHVRLAEATRGGFKAGPNGELPRGIPVQSLLDGPEPRWMLMPLPKKVGAEVPSPLLSRQQSPRSSLTMI